LVLDLDAANATGLGFPGTGCSVTSWSDISLSAIVGVLTNFVGCGSSRGWNGSGTSSDPYRLTFDGTQNDYVVLPSPLFGGNSYSLAIWFQSTADGVLLGDQTYAVGGANPPSYNPVAFIDTSGYLRAGLYSGSAIPVQATVTSTPVNDGNWHHAVITGNETSLVQTLYVDGVLIGTYAGYYDNGIANGENYAQLGTGKTEDWTGATSYYYFNYTGSIAVAQVYNRDLSQSEVIQNCLAHQSRFAGAVCK
jgi:Concanavalin A-like lectin/glucanases superfamily